MTTIAWNTLLEWLDHPPVEWHDQAACRAPGINPNIFFPERGESTEPAKQVCATCPVTEECRDEALKAGWASWAQHGIWGGLSERERRRIRINKPPAATNDTRSCEHCGDTYQPRAAHQRWCTTGCRDDARNARAVKKRGAA